MTAEIAILNKSAVALAADSTVTIASGSGEKTYNTVNKLFTLSKLNPVGVMIYGDAEFMDVPWETLIKQYRKQLENRSFNYVRDYAFDFLKWLEAQTGLLTPVQEARHFEFTAWAIIRSLRDDIDDDVQERSPLPDEEIKATASRHIAEYHDFAVGIEPLPCAGQDMVTSLRQLYDEKLGEIIGEDLGGFGLEDGDWEKAKQTVCHRIASGAGAKTGLVVAGFGEHEMFPAVRTFEFYRSVAGKILYREDENGSHCVTFDSGALVLPFAQKEVVMAFLTGCEQSYTNMIHSMFEEFAQTFPAATADRVAALVPQMTDQQHKELLGQITAKIDEFNEEFDKAFYEHRNSKHIHPLLSVIDALPKDELASMAGALVNLTSVKRKMSMDVETVGGPIDVAVISKGDGFIWINRKHYFRPELNPHFMETYFRR